MHGVECGHDQINTVASPDFGQLVNAYSVMDNQGKKIKVTPEGLDLVYFVGNIDALAKEW